MDFSELIVSLSSRVGSRFFCCQIASGGSRWVGVNGRLNTCPKLPSYYATEWSVSLQDNLNILGFLFINAARPIPLIVDDAGST